MIRLLPFQLFFVCITVFVKSQSSSVQHASGGRVSTSSKEIFEGLKIEPFPLVNPSKSEQKADEDGSSRPHQSFEGDLRQHFPPSEEGPRPGFFGPPEPIFLRPPLQFFGDQFGRPQFSRPSPVFGVSNFVQPPPPLRESPFQHPPRAPSIRDLPTGLLDI